MHPYSTLTPDLVVEAIEAVGHASDGRVLALNSYENRVYQVGRDDSTPVVVKFYRPGRWSTPAILEEHEFALELARAELPIVAPEVHAGRTLFEIGGFRYAVYPRQGGRTPELKPSPLLGQHTNEVLGEWLGLDADEIDQLGKDKII